MSGGVFPNAMCGALYPEPYEIIPGLFTDEATLGQLDLERRSSVHIAAWVSTWELFEDTTATGATLLSSSFKTGSVAIDPVQLANMAWSIDPTLRRLAYSIELYCIPNEYSAEVHFSRPVPGHLLLSLACHSNIRVNCGLPDPVYHMHQP